MADRIAAIEERYQQRHEITVHSEPQIDGPTIVWADCSCGEVSLNYAASEANQPLSGQLAVQTAMGGLRGHPGVNAPEDVAYLLDALRESREQLERLDSWDGLLELLDHHWPATLFPTLPDDDSRDPGPRIVSMIRRLDAYRSLVQDKDRALRESREELGVAVRMLHSLNRAIKCSPQVVAFLARHPDRLSESPEERREP